MLSLRKDKSHHLYSSMSHAQNAIVRSLTDFLRDYKKDHPADLAKYPPPPIVEKKKITDRVSDYGSSDDDDANAY